MNWRLALVAAVAGYTIGSVPFSLVIVRLFGRGAPLAPPDLQVPGSDEILRSDAVSATAVRLQLGARYGCLTSILDMAKATAVTLAFKLIWPQQPYFLIVSGFAVVGHVWPIVNRFRGGRGQSPVIGSLFVIDWPVALIVYPASQMLGLLTGSRALVGRFATLPLAAVWFAYRFGSPEHVLYALGLSLVRLIAMRREIAQYLRLRRDGRLATLSEELEFLHMGDGVPRAWSAIRMRLRRRRPDREP
jgi:glycerol-3-phosphate acyltransferase PlsY